jgi:diguanylate cyclase (GGDEF)-like protein
MVKSYTGTATIDRRLQIGKADRAFYEFIGSENFASLAGCIPPEGLSHFKQIVTDLGIGENFVLVVRMRAADGEYHHVLTELRGLEADERDESYVEVKIQNIGDLEDRLSKVCDENQLYGEFLELWGERLFVYDINQDFLQVFSGGNTNQVYSFRGKLADFRETMLRQDAAFEAHRAELDSFCQDLSQGTKNFEYQVELKEGTDKAEGIVHFVKGKTVLNSRKEQIVLGCILRRNQQGGDTENSLTDSDKDVTTGLLTKKVVLEYTENLLRRRPKYNVNLCVIDIDNFKQVNDTLGHMFGDEVLSTVADIIKEAVAGKGIVGRIGGDEMFVLLEGVHNLADLRGVLRTIRNNVEWAYKDRKEVPPITCSIGVSTYPADGCAYDDLFKIADKMLYLAKQKGKNRYIVYAPEVHGDVLSEAEVSNTSNGVSLRQDKEALVLKMLEYVAQQTNRPFGMLLQEIGTIFGLDEVHLFYGDEKKLLLESYWNVNGDRKTQESFADCVNEENFVHLYKEHNMAVINSLDSIEQLCPRTYHYMSERGIKVAMIYKMECKSHEGYITYCKMSDISRKWSDSDLTNLTYVSKIVELIINDR